MSIIVEVITEHDLEEYAAGDADQLRRIQIEALMIDDPDVAVTIKRLRAQHLRRPQLTPERRPNMTNKAMPNKTKPAAHELEPAIHKTDARQADGSTTPRRVLTGSLVLITGLAIAALALGMSGLSDELNQALPNLMSPISDSPA